MPADPYETVASVIGRGRARGATVLVGIAGGVAVGKSATAAALAGALGGTVEIVSSDGFLLPNAELERRGMFARKGFPESYDCEAIERFLDQARSGPYPIRLPEYSHQAYDVVPDARTIQRRPDVLLFEGVNVLRFASSLDVRIYVDADLEDMERWYVERFRALSAEPEPGTFYALFRGLPADELDEVARAVWREVNLLNLTEAIGPTRAYADIVLEKAGDHSIARMTGTAI
ncbi:MAG TPA: type I pantothenate kinase [Acidimicrobiia bacterium]